MYEASRNLTSHFGITSEIAKQHFAIEYDVAIEQTGGQLGLADMIRARIVFDKMKGSDNGEVGGFAVFVMDGEGMGYMNGGVYVRLHV